MSNLRAIGPGLPAMTPDAISCARDLENFLLTLPAVLITTDHVLHAGQYSRTVMIPAGAVITGALIKIRTTLIVAGDCQVYVGDEEIHVRGYHVIAAEAGRKQAFIANTNTHLTMTFATSARTVAEAEEEFTDEAHLLVSRNAAARNTVRIAGGTLCPE